MKSFTVVILISMLSIFAEAKSVLLCPQALFEEKTLKTGCLWEISGTKSEVKTLHFTASSQQSDYLIQYEVNQIRISNHLGKLRLKLRDGKELLLPAGFEVWISEIQSNKKNAMGIISPIDLKTHTPQLIGLWNSDSKKFKEHFSALVSKWGPHQDIASRYYKGLVERKLASIETEKNRKLRKIRQEKEVRRRNKELLFDRAFSR